MSMPSSSSGTALNLPANPESSKILQARKYVGETIPADCCQLGPASLSNSRQPKCKRTASKGIKEEQEQVHAMAIGVNKNLRNKCIEEIELLTHVARVHRISEGLEDAGQIL